MGVLLLPLSNKFFLLQLNEIKSKINRLNAQQGGNVYVKNEALIKLKKELGVLKSKAAPLEHLIYSLYYTKHYQADLEREDGVTKDYRFYDEREWRYMPEFDCAVCQLRRTEKEYKEWRGTGQYKPLLPEVNLSFNYSDIEHIIVEKDFEAREIIDLIKSFSDQKCRQDLKENLYTKITSFEKIGNDY